MAMESTRQFAELPRGMTRLDLVLPSQYFSVPRKQEPEHRLMMAVLHDAIDCLAKYRHGESRESLAMFHEAENWFLSRESEWPYSFESICGVLDLDADAVRKSLHVVSRYAFATKRSTTPGPPHSCGESTAAAASLPRCKAPPSGHVAAQTGETQPAG